jgi:hypothetical protein
MYPQGTNRYSAWFAGEEIISHSCDPEYDIARAPLTRGITGRALIVDGHTGARRSWVNIDKAARWRMVEESRGRLRRRKWSANTSVKENDEVEDDLTDPDSTSKATCAVRESHEEERSIIHHPASKASGWVAKSYCRTRVGLLHSIREKCGTVDEGALKRVEALAEWHGGAG